MNKRRVVLVEEPTKAEIKELEKLKATPKDPTRFTDWDESKVEFAQRTRIHKPEPEPPEVGVTAEQLNRLLIDEMNGVVRLGQTPTDKRIRKSLARDLAKIKKAGGTVDIPPEIAGEE